MDLPAGFADGIDNDTTYLAGPGLVLTDTIFSADPAVLQLRVGGICGPGFAIREVLQDGGVTCEPVGGGGGGDAWLLTGNSGTTPGVHYVGTSDNVVLELRVNGQRALRIEPMDTSPNLIGGRPGNWLTSGVYGATIGGGGGAGVLNRVTDHFGTVGGGADNQAGNDAYGPEDALYATVGGGLSNSAGGTNSTAGGGYSCEAGGDFSTVGGGNDNAATGNYATAGGGDTNIASGNLATVAGGDGNTASGSYSTVGGGQENASNYEATTVAGGRENTASGDAAAVGGGWANIASGIRATVAGGFTNTASGLRAAVGGGGYNTASGSNSAVCGGYDNTASESVSTVGGGDGNTASGTSATVPGGSQNVAQGAYSFAAGRSAKAYQQGCFVWGDSTDAHVTCDNQDRWVARASGGVYFYTNAGLTSGSYLAAGGTSWNVISDRATKEHFAPVDGRAILETLASLPVQEYNLKTQDGSIRHVGLVAQDFAKFGFGESDKAINMEDADGVALAAIQALYAENQALKAQVAGLDARLSALEAAGGAAQSAQSPSSVRPLWLLAGGLVVVGGTWAARRRTGGGR
jgi:hypothetical protein